MRRTILLSLLAVMGNLMVWGNPIGMDRALQIARTFRGEHLSYSGAKHVAPANMQMKVIDTGFDNLWMVGNENGGDFVVVSGDDRLGPVLAYGESDNLTPGNIPVSMQLMLQNYNRQVSLVASSSSVEQTATPDRQSIAPLIKTMWHQYPPLSLYCPYDEFGERQTLVGCVAVTLAQLMYYYQYPSCPTQVIPAYTTSSGVALPALSPITFEYDKMHVNYDDVIDFEETDINDESLIAVARLLQYCGCALKMDYSAFGSASIFDTDAIAKYFGYDKGCRHLLAGNFPHSVWEEMVYNELKAGRPVPYSASGVNIQTHMFIIDGYDGYGFFHANLGEIGRGGFNVFYKLGVLNDCVGQTTLVECSGYNIYQSAVFGFQPDKGNDALPIVSVDYGSYSLSKTDYTRSSTSADFKNVALNASMKRYDNNGLSMDCGWGLYQYGQLKQVAATTTSSKETTTLPKSLSFGKGLADGTYEIYPIFRNHDAEKWECYMEFMFTDDKGNPMHHYTATINQKELHVGVSSSDPNVKVEKVEYYTAYEGGKLNARAYVTNNGSNYENLLLFWIDGTMCAGLGCYAEPGTSDYVDFCTAAPSVGKHDVMITTDYEGKNVIFKGTLTSTSVPEYALKGDVVITGMDSNGDVHGVMDVSCKVTNVGTQTFADMISANLKAKEVDERGVELYLPENGLPTFPWSRVWYLHLEPGESQYIQFAINNTTFREGNYRYSFNIIHYVNSGFVIELYDKSWIWFRYFDDMSGVEELSSSILPTSTSDWFTLDGRMLSGKPTQKGVYVNNGKKVVIK